MKIARFKANSETIRIGMVSDDRVTDLTGAGIESLQQILEQEDPKSLLSRADLPSLESFSKSEVTFVTPVENQEVWAAGVTYLRSKAARMGESEFSEDAYDKVYEALRPELFFKSMPGKVVSPGESVGIRKDARWNVPEPELAFFINSKGTLVGYSIGNDMSSRDIEGENLLYLPQAKVYDRSCALGPCISIGNSELEVRDWSIRVQIRRNGDWVFDGNTKIDQLKRSFQELVDYVCR
ncbi:MAG TPA: fumarylacetoacetate hydrolase, partial [Verrucomicrobia bacterium]|nr:fumarylacetoacetate hydrolase [Verrucomicrobiota bacterium]